MYSWWDDPASVLEFTGRDQGRRRKETPFTSAFSPVEVEGFSLTCSCLMNVPSIYSETLMPISSSARFCGWRERAGSARSRGGTQRGPARMSSAPRPRTAAGNRGEQCGACHRTAEPAAGGGGEKQPVAFLRPTSAPEHPVSPTLCLSSRAGLHPAVWPLLLLARTLAKPGSQAPEAKVQPDSHGSGLGRQPGPGRAVPAPQDGCGEAAGARCPSPSPQRLPGVALSWRGGLPTCSSSTRIPEPHTG